jgi:hypothetical protein
MTTSACKPFFELLAIPVLPACDLLEDSQCKVGHHGCQQKDTQHGRSESVIVGSRSSFPDGICSPVIRNESVDHGHHGHDGEETGRDTTDFVAKVQEADCQATEDDGKVEPPGRVRFEY